MHGCMYVCIYKGRCKISWFENAQEVVPMPNQSNLSHPESYLCFVTEKPKNAFLHILHHFY